jgi:hypothetical protein
MKMGAFMAADLADANRDFGYRSEIEGSGIPMVRDEDCILHALLARYCSTWKHETWFARMEIAKGAGTVSRAGSGF